MSAPLSTHIPGLSGAFATVPAATGTLVVDTGLQELQSFCVSLAEDQDADVAGVSWEPVAAVAGTTRKVTIKTWEDDGTTAGSTAALVSWIAMGR